jgi:hypothetical protein
MPSVIVLNRLEQTPAGPLDHRLQKLAEVAAEDAGGKEWA